MTAPKSELVHPCINRTSKSVSLDRFSTLEMLLPMYQCGVCFVSKPKKTEWLCAALSETLEIHPGFLPYALAADMVIMHSRRVVYTSTHIDAYTLPNGTVLKNFIHTENGFLSSYDNKCPGNYLFIVSGFAIHSSLYHVEREGAWDELVLTNSKFSALRSMVYSTILLVNPTQSIETNRGKMYLDLTPSVISDWLHAFLDTWNDFVRENPGVSVKSVYRTDTEVWYGSPSDHPDAVKLEGYPGLPVLLQYTRERMTDHFCWMFALIQMKTTDASKFVPSGKLIKFLLYFTLTVF